MHRATLLQFITQAVQKLLNTPTTLGVIVRYLDLNLHSIFVSYKYCVGGIMKKALKVLGILICVFLGICLIVGIVTSTSTSDLEYTIDDVTNTITITGINSNKNHIVIPEMIDGYKVTSISDYAFKDNENVLSIQLPNTISHIGKGAFYNCNKLAFVWGLEKCNRLTKIEDEVFYNCKRLKQIKLPNNITSIGNSAFESCHKLKKLQLPDSVSYIGKKAFDNCQSIIEFDIPQGVTKIEEKTFFSCLAMKSIELPEGITIIGEAAFANCYELKSIAIPSTVEMIDKNAFTTCKSLSSITIPEGVKEIGDFAFIECSSLSEITIPASVVRLGGEIFRSNSALKKINVSPQNTVYASIDGVLYNKDVTELIAYPAGKTDKSFSIPDGVISIDKAVFAYNTTLETVSIPESVKSIGNFFLYETSIKTINYNGTVSQWNKIDKVGGLDLGNSFQTINCTDGQISKYGKVTYN